MSVIEYFAWYLVIGYIVAFASDRFIRYSRIVEPYTPKEIFISIILWPLVILSMIYFYFKN